MKSFPGSGCGRGRSRGSGRGSGNRLSKLNCASNVANVAPCHMPLSWNLAQLIDNFLATSSRNERVATRCGEGAVAWAEHNTNSNCVEASRATLPKIRPGSPRLASHRLLRLWLVAVCSGSI